MCSRQPTGDKTVDLVYKVVQRLLRDDDVGFSRNRNFEAYEDPTIRQAARIFRHLKSVEDNLLASPEGQVRIEAVEQRSTKMVIRLTFLASETRRISYLNGREWELLLANGRVAEILREALDATPDETRYKLLSLIHI